MIFGWGAGFQMFTFGGGWTILEPPALAADGGCWKAEKAVRDGGAIIAASGSLESTPGAIYAVDGAGIRRDGGAIIAAIGSYEVSPPIDPGPGGPPVAATPGTPLAVDAGPSVPVMLKLCTVGIVGGGIEAGSGVSF
jgi:hypothetical protein